MDVQTNYTGINTRLIIHLRFLQMPPEFIIWLYFIASWSVIINSKRTPRYYNLVLWNQSDYKILVIEGEQTWFFSKYISVL